MRRMGFISAVSVFLSGCAYIPLSMFPTDSKKMEDARIAEENKRRAIYENRLVVENYRRWFCYRAYLNSYF
jgi:hypothetical protein